MNFKKELEDILHGLRKKGLCDHCTSCVKLVDEALTALSALIERERKEARIDELQRLAMTAGVNIEVNDYTIDRLAELRGEDKA
jgi:hypothetical protein